MIFQLFLIGLIIFIFYAIYSIDYEKSYNDPRTDGELMIFMKIIEKQLETGQITEEEYYEKYSCYKKRRKEWELNSGYADYRESLPFEGEHWKKHYSKRMRNRVKVTRFN